MSDNVVDMQRARALREAKNLFAGYEARLKKMDKFQVAEEIIKMRIEMSRYPNHLLTVAKRKIIERITGEKICTR